MQNGFSQTYSQIWSQINSFINTKLQKNWAVLALKNEIKYRGQFIAPCGACSSFYGRVKHTNRIVC